MGVGDNGRRPVGRLLVLTCAAAAVVLVQGCGGCGRRGERDEATLVFHRVTEPNEQAFSLLVPMGWETLGGIFRVDPTRRGGPMQSIAAKVDFAVRSDAAGTAMIRWLPDMMYYDPRYSPAAAFGVFNNRKQYQGMEIRSVMPAAQFLREVVFPYAHPGAQNVTIEDERSLPKLAQSHQARLGQLFQGASFSYDAAALTAAYDEGGVRYVERLVAVVEDWGQLGAGMWGNKETFCARTPADDLETYEKVLGVIQGSVIINQQWLAGELRGQLQRTKIYQDTQREIQRIGDEIAKHRQQTVSEIHNDVFLTLTEQEEYVNPYTKQVELGSNQWKYRWINEGGEVIYTDNRYYDPNVDKDLNRSDYKRTPIRPRAAGNS